MRMVHLIFGRPLAWWEDREVKIGVVSGVPTLGLDALSSSAYGPEAALAILIPVGAAGLGYVEPITWVILILLGLLYISYRQTITAYPNGGGSYTVAKENLGTYPSLIAGAALMLDYILNVAVGISAGVAALISAVPALHPYTLWLCLAVLLLITAMNLRGTREAGLAFALPTWLFVLSMAVLLLWGLYRGLTSGEHPQPQMPLPPLHPATEAVGVWLLLRAFASGCTAMTGVEAVSNAVSAFKEPRTAYARWTLTVIVVLLAGLLLGVAHLARLYHVGAMDQEQPGYQSIISQVAQATAGRGTLYYTVLGSALAVLCLSANTSFTGFPQLCRLIATDGFLPKGFTVRGRRLAYSVGVLSLMLVSAALLVLFGGITNRLIPLFAVGAFMAFTLSQAGMVVHWWKVTRSPGKRKAAVHKHAKERQVNDLQEEPEEDSALGRPPGKTGAYVRLVVNAVGATATALALLVILAAKFVEGAWLIVLAIPLLVGLFVLVHRYYERVKRRLACPTAVDLKENLPPLVVVPVGSWNRPTELAVRLAMQLSPDVVAVHLVTGEAEDSAEEGKELKEVWREKVLVPAKKAERPAPELELFHSPYRRITRQLVEFVGQVTRKNPHRIVAVVIPEVVERHWWEILFHFHRGIRLMARLLLAGEGKTVVINVPWRL